MTKRKTLFILGALTALAISCSITNGETSGAALLSNGSSSTPGTPTAAQIDQPTQTPTPRPESCTVTAHALNMRTCGGTHCGVLAVLDEGDDLTILAAGDWLNVETDTGLTGYINGAYCANGE